MGRFLLSLLDAYQQAKGKEHYKAKLNDYFERLKKQYPNSDQAIDVLHEALVKSSGVKSEGADALGPFPACIQEFEILTPTSFELEILRKYYRTERGVPETRMRGNPDGRGHFSLYVVITAARPAEPLIYDEGQSYKQQA
jgi:hypothetical protein